ncbi:hypothetical protein [Kitasatospora sp. NPDC050463]|uniref:hypothetical protein n=1 Tax=Kitasatospora sp. NPDC050463 TaxID=3155786 RepID=UPI0033FE0722
MRARARGRPADHACSGRGRSGLGRADHPAGLDALRYRRDRAAVTEDPAPEPVEPPDESRRHIELHSVDIDALNSFLTAASDLQGADIRTIREVLEQARAVPGTRRRAVALTDTEEKALGYAFWLDSLTGVSRSHYHFRRECEHTIPASDTRTS